MNDPISPQDHIAITTASAEFGHLVDHGRATECEALFTEDARLVFAAGSPKPGTLAGIASIRAFLAARQAQAHVTTRHVASNFRLHPATDNTVAVTSLLAVYRSDDESREPVVTVVADIEETFVQVAPGQWKITERITRPIFTKS